MGSIRSIWLGLVTVVVFASCSKEQEEQYDYRDLGVSAHDILSAGTYTQLEIEINYMPGYVITDSVKSGVESFLSRYINKPAGIRFISAQVPSTGKADLTIREVVDLEKRYRTRFSRGQVLAIHVLVTDAEFSEDDIFGISYWNTSTCIFGGTVSRFSGRPGKMSRDHLFIMLLRHELLHLMGLVGQGSPMVIPHRDLANGAHCDNQFCLMTHQLETDLIGGQAIMPELDANCEADLTNNGGK